MNAAPTALQFARSDTSWLTEWRRTVDWGLMGGAFFLIAIGLLMSLAAGPTAAKRIGYSYEYFFVIRQAAFAVCAAVILIGFSALNQTWARRAATAIFIGALLLMVWILVFGHEAKGAQRWLRVAGFSLQPSEMVKPALIVLSGWLLAQREAYPSGPWAVIAFVITFFISGLPWKWAAAFAGGGVSLAGLLYALLPHVRARVNSFVNPTQYDTYQIDKAAEAIGRGGLFGVGPGEGQVKASLPDAHTDFIFSVMVEEFGLIAAIVLLAVFALMVLRGFRAAARLDDGYARAAAAGLFTLFGLQAAINMAVNVALIPPKGMTLPFVSYGGSSMIGTALTLGLALALVRGQGTRIRGRYG